jgi:hypothetical protein
MRHLLVPAMVVLLAAGGAMSASLSDRVDDFEEVVATRIAVLAGNPNPTPEEKKEATGLAKVLATLGAYADGTGSKDLGIIAKALGTAFKANSPDAEIADQAGEVLSGLDGLASSASFYAGRARDLILDPTAKAKVQAAIDKAEVIRSGATAVPDWGAQAKILARGIAAFGKAESLAGKVLGKQFLAFGALGCSVVGKPAFDADPGMMKAVRTADGGLLITGEMAGNPMYGISLGVAGPVLRGWSYPLVNADSVFFEDAGAGTIMSYATSGSMAIDTISKTSVSGTFTFVSAGAVELTAGEFRLPISKK